uniref:Cytochrome c oxidase subunit 3 n=1 Tax=Tanacetum cinerariifolium TaxID=118510 RepID=A0A6L2PB99_TANCI|nr:cytochrome c oxidase subunit 3, mitochondrial [Tanacetum cinerariifolium]
MTLFGLKMAQRKPEDDNVYNIELRELLRSTPRGDSFNTIMQIYIAADRALTCLLCKSFQHGQVVIVSGTYFSAVPIRSKFGGVILQSLSSLSIDQREIFSLYLFPGNDLSKRLVLNMYASFVYDGMMLEQNSSSVTMLIIVIHIKAMLKLDQGDSFNVMAFNDQTYLYSSTLELARKESLQKVTDWIGMNFNDGSGTNMSAALNQEITFDNLFLTDGAIEDDRQICEVMKKQLRSQGSKLCPRICTFGIVEIGGIWPPKGIAVLNPREIPFLNTLIPLSSGATVTWAHHAILAGKEKRAVYALVATVSLALVFIAFQGMEYYQAPSTILDSIYGATFFLATGFHGFHVIIGTLFSIICGIRQYLGHLTKEHHVGFEAAAWNWHFVDVVWLFPFVSICCCGSD